MGDLIGLNRFHTRSKFGRVFRAISGALTCGRKPPIVLLHNVGRVVGSAIHGVVGTRNLTAHFDLANGRRRRSREVWLIEKNSQHSQIAPVAQLPDEAGCPCCGALIFAAATV